jgi:hypothetical protein
MYDVRLLNRMRREVVALGSEFAAEVRDARRRTPLRVVAENEAPGQAAEADEEPQQQNDNGR